MTVSGGEEDFERAAEFQRMLERERSLFGNRKHRLLHIRAWFIGEVGSGKVFIEQVVDVRP